jgi:serine/threonine protein kinase
MNILHLDIKPDNIRVKTHEHKLIPILIDLGCVKDIISITDAKGVEKRCVKKQPQ